MRMLLVRACCSRKCKVCVEATANGTAAAPPAAAPAAAPALASTPPPQQPKTDTHKVHKPSQGGTESTETQTTQGQDDMSNKDDAATENKDPKTDDEYSNSHSQLSDLLSESDDDMIDLA